MGKKNEVMTPEELALYWGVSRNLIYRELKAGHIPHVRVGDLYKISRETAERLLKGELQPA